MIPPTRLTVPGTKGSHTVTFADYGLGLSAHCTCKSMQYRGTCKHVKAAGADPMPTLASEPEPVAFPSDSKHKFARMTALQNLALALPDGLVKTAAMDEIAGILLDCLT